MVRSFILSVLLTAALPAAAQLAASHADEHEQPVVRDPALTLSAALDGALARAPGGALPQARLNESRVLAERADSLLSAPPAVQMRYQTDRLPGRGGGLRELEAGLELPLWRGGQRDALRREADASRLQSEEEQRSYRWRVAGELRENLWRVLAAEAEVTLADADVDLYRALEEDVAKRVRGGDAAPFEKLSAETARRERDALLYETQVELAHSLFGWTALTGLKVLPAVALERPADSVPEGVSDEAPSAYPPVLIARAAVERVHRALGSVQAQGSGAPRVLIGVRSESATDTPTTDSVGATLSIPFGGEAHRAAAQSPLHLDLARAEDELAWAQRHARAARSRARTACARTGAPPRLRTEVGGRARGRTGPPRLPHR